MNLTAHSRTTRIAMALVFALVALTIAVANASAAPNHKRTHKHHRKHHTTHVVPKPKIGPAGDGDADNTGAPSDGDGGV